MVAKVSNFSLSTIYDRSNLFLYRSLSLSFSFSFCNVCLSEPYFGFYSKAMFWASVFRRVLAKQCNLWHFNCKQCNPKFLNLKQNFTSSDSDSRVVSEGLRWWHKIWVEPFSLSLSLYFSVSLFLSISLSSCSNLLLSFFFFFLILLLFLFF